MSDVFWQNLPALLVAIAAIPGSIATVVISLRNRDAHDKDAAILKQGQADIKNDTTMLPEIKRATDGMTTRLVASALVEGAANGKAEEQAHPTTVSVPITNGGRRGTDQ